MKIFQKPIKSNLQTNQMNKETPTMDEVLKRNGINHPHEDAREQFHLIYKRTVAAMTEWEQITSAPLLKRIEELEGRYNQLNKGYLQLGEQLRGKEFALQLSEDQSEKANAACEQYSVENSQLQQRVSELEKERDELNHGIRNAIDVKDEYKAEIESLKAENEKLKRLIIDRKDIEEWLKENNL